MTIGKGQSYRAFSFDVGFINMTPIEIVLQITDIDSATNELELAFVSVGVCHSEGTRAAISKWFEEIYPSTSKENCMLKNACAFKKLVDLKIARPERFIFTHDQPLHLSATPAEAAERS